MAENGKINAELKAIRKIDKALEGMTPQQKNRVLGFVQQAVWERMGPPSALNVPAQTVTHPV